MSSYESDDGDHDHGPAPHHNCININKSRSSDYTSSSSSRCNGHGLIDTACLIAPGGALLAMNLKIVIMTMALLTTTSHCININKSSSSDYTYSSSSRCNGLTDTACHIAHSELDFDLEFMLDSEISRRLIQTVHFVDLSKKSGKSAACDRGQNSPGCHPPAPDPKPRTEHCKEIPYIRECSSYP